MMLMYQRQKVIAAILVIAIISTICLIPVNASTSDISGHWAEKVLQKWIDLDLVRGYGDGQYKPNGNITRAEFITLLNNMANNDQLSDNISQYKDVKPTDWYYKEIARAIAAGYIKGTSKSTISPLKNISRQEAIVIILNYSKIEPLINADNILLAKDGFKTSEWAKGHMAAAIDEGLISGSAGNIYPQNNITRAESITLLDKVMTDTRTYSFKGIFGSETKVKDVANVVVKAPEISLRNINITGDLEIAKEVGDGDVSLDGVNVNGNLYLNGGGINTILFNNVDVKGALIVNKINGNIRILATGKTDIAVTVLSSGAILIEQTLTGAGFRNVKIEKSIIDGQSILIEGNINKLENAAENLDIKVNGTINELSSVKDLVVNGKVEVEKIIDSVDDVSISIPDEDTGSEVEESPIATPSSSSSPNTSQGQIISGGSGSNGEIYAESIIINDKEKTAFVVGEKKNLTTSLLPSNTTNKSITWYSSNEGILSVDQMGNVEAKSTGEATITASTQNGRNDAITIQVISFEELCLAIDNVYLGDNEAPDYVFKNLNLINELEQYPGIIISWSSDSSNVNVLTGEIVREDNDIVAILSVIVDERECKSYNINILSQKIENVSFTGTDSRFASGYPRAYIQDDTIRVEFKTITDAKVYMIINSMNGSWESSIEGVLGGYGGAKDDLIWIDGWPYFEAHAEELISFDTGISVSSGGSEKRMDFLLRDIDDTNQGDLVTILFDKVTLEALDNTGPSLTSAFINKDMTKIYLYYDEQITAENLVVADFSLNSGEITAIDNVVNYYEGYSSWGSSYIILSISGITNSEGLSLSYDGENIKDKSIYENKDNVFSNYAVRSLNSTITDVMLGNDGKSVMVTLENGPNCLDPDIPKLEKEDFVINTISGEKTPSNIWYYYSMSGMGIGMNFNEVLDVDNDSYLSINKTKAGLVDYGYDVFDSNLQKVITNNFSGILDKTPHTVLYNPDLATFELIFDENFSFDYMVHADNFVLDIDGTEYRLRGQLAGLKLEEGNNIVTINLMAYEFDNYSKKLKDMLSTAQNVKIKYEIAHGENGNQLRDLGGSLLPAFDYEDVIR